MNGPPKIETRSCQTALRNRELSKAYYVWPVLQTLAAFKGKQASDIVSAVWIVWKHEAARLFAEYWRTNDLKHLLAFARHVHAMRTYEGRPEQ